MAWAIHKQAALAPAAQVAGEALAQAEILGDSLLIGQSVHLLGEIALRRGDFDQAEELHLRSLALLRAVDAQPALADVYFSLSENAYFRSDYASARDYARQCYHIHLALGLNPATNNNLTCLGIFTAEAGDLDAGEAYVRQSIALCRSSSAQPTLAHALKTLVGFMMLRKAWEQARSYVDESLQIAESIGEEWLIPDILIFSGRLYSLIGDHAAAQHNTSLAVMKARETGYRLTLLEALIHLAEVRVAANDIEHARAALHEGLEGAVQTRTPILMLYGVFVAAECLKQENPVRAAELVGLLLRCSGLENAIRNELPALAAQLEAQLGAQHYAVAFKRGQGLRLQDAAEHLAMEFAPCRVE